MKAELFVTYIVGPGCILGSFWAFFLAGQTWAEYHTKAVVLMVIVALAQFAFGVGLMLVGMTRK